MPPQSRRSAHHAGAVNPRPRLAALIVWWIGIAVIASLALAALVGVAYSRVVYLVAVIPAAGLLLFPAAWAANRWLTPLLTSWLRRAPKRL